MSVQRYCIVDNESGDKYFIPVEKMNDWNEWLYSEDWEQGNTPDYAGHIDGRFSFTDPQTNCS